MTASYPVSVRQVAALLHASFRPRLTTTPLRFASTSPPSGCAGDFHPQAVKHARHTTKRLRRRGCCRTVIGSGAGLDWGSAAAWYPRAFRPWGRNLVLGFLMEDITVTKLRKRMIEDMRLAGLAPGARDKPGCHAQTCLCVFLPDRSTPTNKFVGATHPRVKDVAMFSIRAFNMLASSVTIPHIADAASYDRWPPSGRTTMFVQLSVISAQSSAVGFQHSASCPLCREPPATAGRYVPPP